MPYAFLNPDGTIKQVIAKPSPFMRLGEGERMVNYNPPIVDDAMYRTVPTVPVAEGTLDVAFTVEPLPDEVVWPVIRRQRDALLAQSDWTDTASAPARLGEAVYTAWRTYRQALRDITQQADPRNISWPVPPGA